MLTIPKDDVASIPFITGNSPLLTFPSLQPYLHFLEKVERTPGLLLQIISPDVTE